MYKGDWSPRLSIRIGQRNSLRIVEGMDGCEEAVSTGEGGAVGKMGGGSFWDMALSASLIRSSYFAKVRSALLSKSVICLFKYSPMTWGAVRGSKSVSASSYGWKAPGATSLLWICHKNVFTLVPLLSSRKHQNAWVFFCLFNLGLWIY